MVHLVHHRKDGLPEEIASGNLESRDPERNVLMVDPGHFDVSYVINPHMADVDGNPLSIDRNRARQQWEELKDTYEKIGLGVSVLEGEPGFPDMVFCANQSLPFREQDGSLQVIASVMAYEARRGEVEAVMAWYARQGYALHSIDGGPFEGMGDLLWLPDRRLLFGGYGFRTSVEVLDQVAHISGTPVLALRLVDERFYHLDTALAPLAPGIALIHRGAFDAEGLALIDSVIPDLIEVPEEEAVLGFACNAHCPDGHNVVVDKACPQTIGLLEDRSFLVHAVDTSEFRKAGGSVFCMKMMLP